MQYSKPMIDLVYEIRRRVDAAMKPGVKLANPEMLDELQQYYQGCKDVITKALIKELFSLAGDGWPQRLEAPPPPPPETPQQPHQIVKVYRGQVSLETVAPDTSASAKPQRIYRGQIINN